MPDDEPGGTPPVPSGADFASLIERARAAHVAEVERLRLEAQLLRRELLAARGELGEPPGPGLAVAGRGSEARAAAAEGREEAEDALPEAAELRSSSSQEQCRPTHAQRSSTSSRGLGRKMTGERVGLDRGRLWALVTKPEFEATFAVMILANALLLVLEAQYKSFSLATSTGHGSAIGESADVWPVAEDVFGVLSWAFGTVFLLELVLKVAALRFDFVTDAWNWMDSIVVLAWFFSEVLQVGANVQFLRVFRLVRLARFARVLKLISRGRSDGLFIMGIALADSIPTTVWVFLSLLVVHCLLALGMNEFLCTRGAGGF
ncbi:unnamed protein product [Prorocentrum cordatum]|uniref:Ion transport domain-containing protein n=1 Tax=Prorocentrum cordatum TaxID=2364126 RepID=A0ABN9Y1W1_9DINO|nr:unnamed protein product [Polarella glacialis]